LLKQSPSQKKLPKPIAPLVYDRLGKRKATAASIYTVDQEKRGKPCPPISPEAYRKLIGKFNPVSLSQNLSREVSL
jgi:hypothetical protein